MNKEQTSKIFEDRLEEIDNEVLHGDINEHRRKYLLIRKEETHLMYLAFNTYWFDIGQGRKKKELIFTEKVQLWNDRIMLTVITSEEAREMIESGQAKRINQAAIQFVELGEEK